MSQNSRRFSHVDFYLLNKWKVRVLLFFALLYGSAEIGFVLFFNWANNILDQSRDWKQLILPVILLASFWIFQVTINLWSGFFRTILESRYAVKCLTDVFVQLAKVKQKHLDNSSTGEIAGRTIEDSKTAFDNFFKPIFESVDAFAVMIANTSAVFILHWQTGLIFTAAVFANGLMTYLSITVLRQKQVETRQASSNVWKLFYESLRNMRFIRTNNIEKTYLAENDAHLKKYRNKELNVKRWEIYFYLFDELIYIAAWMGIFVFSITSHISNPDEMTIAKIGTVIIACMNLRWPVRVIVEQSKSFNKIRVSFDRLNEMMSLSAHNPVIKSFDFKDGSIAFKNVNFSYAGKRKILENASFNFESGSTYAVVGKTGMGKSTIFDLIIGMYPIDSGELIVGGVAVSDESTHAIRNQVTFCYQMPYLMNDTIMNNLKLLNPEVSEKKFNEVIEVVGVREIINRLTEGFNTQIGDSGTQLSGGERKRVQLAQCLMRESQIYMFDELTASLDQQTALMISENIKKYLSSKTLIFIEHRIAMLGEIKNTYEFRDHTLHLKETSA